MNRSVLFSLLAGVWLVACNPSSEPVSYFEPMNTVTGESNSWLLPLTPSFDQGRANQAAGAERLGTLSGTTDAVRYRMLDRYSAFMLSGDLTTGTPLGGASFETLQLPASPPADASGEQPERTVSLLDFEPRKWTSFRVYNRGACSSMADWPSLAQSFGDAIADQLNGDPDINNASITGSLGVMLRSEFPNAIGAPDDRDQLKVHAHMTADSITSCRNVGLDIDFAVELQHTDAMQLPVQVEAFAVGCRLNQELQHYNGLVRSLCGWPTLPLLNDPFWLDPAQTEPVLAQLRSVAGIDSDCQDAAQSFISDIRRERSSIQSALAAGREVTCDPGALLFFSLDDSDWTLRRHRELSGRGASDDSLLLLGISNMDGHDLGAHDTLARVVSVDAHNFTASNRWRWDDGGVCHHPRRSGIMDSIEGALRDSLPLAINAAVRSGTVQNPVHLSIPEYEWRNCRTDADCDFRAQSAFATPIGPAFTQFTQWRGARAVCRHHPFHNPCSTERVCWPALEVDRINVRPEGLEVVVEDDINLDVDPQDPQVSFFTPLVRSQVCDGDDPLHTRRREGFLTDDQDPDYQDRSQMSFAIATTSGSGGPQCPPSPVEMVP